MDYYSMTDSAITAEIGMRLKSLRLRKNLTQQQLSSAVLVSLNSIKSLEGGKGKLSTLIAVLRELDALNTLDSFIPEPGISPIQLARQQGKQRQRASGTRMQKSPEEDGEW